VTLNKCLLDTTVYSFAKMNNLIFPGYIPAVQVRIAGPGIKTVLSRNRTQITKCSRSLTMMRKRKTKALWPTRGGQ
jgi:hypothetical protein